MVVQIIPSDIPSQNLAELIVDAMVDGGVVSMENFEAGVAIATEEIDARKAVRDYWCSRCPNQAPLITADAPDYISESKGKILWVNLRPFLNVLAQLAHYQLTEAESILIAPKVNQSNCTLVPPNLVDYGFNEQKRIRFQLGLDPRSKTIQVHLSLPASQSAQAALTMELMGRYSLDSYLP